MIIADVLTFLKPDCQTSC